MYSFRFETAVVSKIRIGQIEIIHAGEYLACGNVAVYLWHLVARGTS